MNRTYNQLKGLFATYGDIGQLTYAQIAQIPTFSGSVVGTSSTAGSALGQVQYQGTASGSSSAAGAIVGSIGYLGISSGSSSLSGQISGSVGYLGAVAGTSNTSGNATGAEGSAGVIEGSSNTSFLVAGSPQLIGSASGDSSTLGQVAGVAASSEPEPEPEPEPQPQPQGRGKPHRPPPVIGPQVRGGSARGRSFEFGRVVGRCAYQGRVISSSRITERILIGRVGLKGRATSRCTVSATTKGYKIQRGWAEDELLQLLEVM